MAILFVNNLQAIIQGSITAIQTAITIDTASAAKLSLPAVAGDDYYIATMDNGTSTEIVHITEKTGAVITIIRARESTTALTYIATDTIDFNDTAGMFAALAMSNNVLALNNMIPFTPVDDYNPATKKFVIDNASGGTADDLLGLSSNGIVTRSGVNNYVIITQPSGAIVGESEVQTLSYKTLDSTCTIDPSIVPSGTSVWNNITDFTATPASTSTITMTSDLTATIKPGMGLRYEISSTDYYGMVTAITSGLMTIRGAPLSGSITELKYRTSLGGQGLESFKFDGEFANGAASTLINDDLAFTGGKSWLDGPAYIIGIRIGTETDDSGASVQPAVNVTIGGSDVLTSDLTIPNATKTDSVVQISTANYDLAYNDTIEVSVTAGTGSAGDAKQLTIEFMVVYP